MSACQKDYPVNVTRRLCGSRVGQRDVEIEVPAYLWPVALALADADDLGGVIEAGGGSGVLSEPRARALATAMGCVLPGECDWLLTASKPKREMQVIADPLFHHRV